MRHFKELQMANKHENMLCFASKQTNANENTNEIILYTNQIGKNKIALQ